MTPAVTQSFLLQRVQPALTGLIDGSLSTLAPIFSVALATHRPHYAFFAGLATAIGAGISMAFSEGLSDTGDFTGRGNPYVRGSITGMGTFLGGILHTLPFLIPDYRTALVAAVATIALELLGARLDSFALLQGALPGVVRFRHARRRDHRRHQRGAGNRGRGMTHPAPRTTKEERCRRHS